MNLSEYASRYKLISEGLQISNVTGETDEDTVKQAIEVSNGKWIAKKLSDGSLYLFHDMHYIDISELALQMDKIYSEKGYSGYGYDKLEPDELIRYSGFRAILSTLITQSISDKLDTRATAESIFEREIFYV